MEEVILIVGGSIALLLIALYFTDKVKYFSQARAMTAPAFALTMIPAFYTVFGASYQIDLMAAHGISQWWYYAVSWYPAYVLGIILGGAIRATGQHLTLPDRFAKYGSVAEFLSSIVSFAYVMPLDVMLMLGLLGVLLTNGQVPFEICCLILGFFLVAYTAKKGWSGYSLAGILYFVFMALGVGVSSLALVQAAGGWGTMMSTLPKEMLTPWFTDINGFLQGLTNPATLIWFLLGFVFIIDPMVWQRFSLAESSHAVRKGMIFAFVFWIVFDLSTVASGFAVATLGTNPYLDTAYTSLPAVWVGLMVAGNLMMALAGGSAYLHAGGMIFSRNLAKSFGLVTESQLRDSNAAKVWYERGVWILGVITIALTLALNYFLPEDPTTMAWLVVTAPLTGAIAFPLIFGGLFLRESRPIKVLGVEIPSVPSLAVKLGLIFGLATTIPLMIYGIIEPNAVSFLTLGITPETASGTPYLDASRVIGFAASIVGWLLGCIIQGVKYLMKTRMEE